MLDEIHVQNLALIQEAELIPGSGLTVLTGETGAGKTALLSAMKLLMGDRASAQAVRDGESQLRVSGRFYFPAANAGGAAAPNALGAQEAPAAEGAQDPCAAFLDESGELVVSRIVTSDGRSRVSLNGEMASVNQLASTVAPHVDLCGQHEHQQLLKPAAHVNLLDSWTGDQAAQALAAYREAFDAAKQAEAALRQVLEAGSANAAQIEAARFVLQRIDAVNPQEGEYEELLSVLELAQHGESLAIAANGAFSALSDEEGAIDKLNEAIAALQGAEGFDPSLAAYTAQLRSALAMAEDVAADVRGYRDRIDFDPQTLEAQQERMAAMQGLVRTYGPRMQDVFAAREAARQQVVLVDDASECERLARRAVDAAETQLAQAAANLAAVRAQAAPRFAQDVCGQMARLHMGTAQLECRVADLPREQWTRAGSQQVEFLFKPGSGMQAHPLAKIASGGEISRVMLAIKAVLGAHDGVDTLVFDEIDAGTGGATASALADVLADLAQTHQVIVVTHLAQVAVRAQTHYVVSKTEDDVPRTMLHELSPAERPAEIARMLSGEVTPASIAHAQELLARAAE